MHLVSDHRTVPRWAGSIEWAGSVQLGTAFTLYFLLRRTIPNRTTELVYVSGVLVTIPLG